MRSTAIVTSIVAALMAALLVGCKSDQTSASTGEGVISGYISDGSSSARLTGVALQALTVSGSTLSTTSDANGLYTFKFTVDSTMNVTMTLKKTGYRDTSFVVQISSGTVLSLNLVMSPVSIVVPPSGSGTGTAQTIYFMGVAPARVSVYGVGGKETAIMSWEVHDSLGLPIDEAHAVNLTFTVMGGVNGGEYVSPAVVRTNANGQANMTFNAGIKAGVVQVIASVDVAGRTITSGPIRVIITAGFPDQVHFSIAADFHNFPALHWVGKRVGISVLVGDKYSNPAAPSAVYFSSSAGVIQAGPSNVVTTDDGQATAELISGNPEPFGIYAAQGAQWGNGYHWVVSRTVGEAGAIVKDSTMMLWSGPGLITNVSPATFDIPDEGSQTVSFKVCDELGHPLAAGTRISVKATIPPPPVEGAKQNQVFLSFGTDGVIELPDVILPGPGTTDFSYDIRDGTWGGEATVTPVNVSITVTGPNTPNSISFTMTGLVH